MSLSEKLKISVITDTKDLSFFDAIKQRVLAEICMEKPDDYAMTPAEYLNPKAIEHADAFARDPTSRFVKATLPSGEIIGIIKWNFFTTPEKAPFQAWPTALNGNANRQLCDLYFGGLDELRNDAMKGKKYLSISQLIVAPEHQNSGVEKELLDWGLEQADEQKWFCWVDASYQGVSAYERLGFKEVAYIDIELSKFGGRKGHVRRTCGLMRKPQARAALDE